MDPRPPAGVDISTPSVARMVRQTWRKLTHLIISQYDFYLGGSHNYPADRVAVDAVKNALPNIVEAAIEGRSFLKHVVRFMCQQGIDQFIDIGSGLPSADNTHQVAERVLPGAHVVYVDIDETAVAHGRQLLAGNTQTAFILGSALETESILVHPEVKELINFSKPVGVLMMGLVHFFDMDVARNLFASLHKHLAPGSLLGITHGTTDGMTEEAASKVRAAYAKTATPLRTRSGAEIGEMVDGFDKVDPGLVKLHEWYMDLAEDDDASPPETGAWYGVVLRV